MAKTEGTFKLPLLLFSVCFICALLVALAYAEGGLSPRGLGIALLAVCVGTYIGTVLIVRKVARQPSVVRHNY